jgi:hypothetical protein
MEKKRTAKTGYGSGAAAVMEKPQAPANKQDQKERIKRTAYAIYEKRGYAHGYDLQDWLEAEKIVQNGK